jgi:hypothetical protein
MVPNRYPFEMVEETMTRFFRARSDHQLAQRAYRRFRCLVLMLAVTEYGMLDTQDEKARNKALSFSWEDMDVAFRGFGDNCTTGFVMQIWSALEKKDWPEFKKMMGDVLDKAQKEAIKRGVTPRYSQRYLHQAVRDLDQDFCLPTALPLTGPVARDWARDNDHDPDKMEHAMLYIEAIDRMKTKAKITKNAEKARAKFELLPGKKDE